jgi:hypothetical protein
VCDHCASTPREGPEDVEQESDEDDNCILCVECSVKYWESRVASRKEQVARKADEITMLTNVVKDKKRKLEVLGINLST